MSRGKRSKKKNRTMLDLQVVTLIIASILLTILIYTKAGYIGQTLSPILGGIMGWIKYIIPVGTFAIAIFLACDEDKDNFMKKILQYAVFLLCITTIITVIQISQGKLSTANGFEEAIKQAYYNGSKNIGGGAVGAICAIGLINLVGKIGTVIIAIGIAIIDSIFLFGIKPAELLKEYIETRNEKKQEAKAQRIEQRKLRADKEVIPKEKEEKKKKSKIMPEDNIVTEDQINIKMANNNEEQTSLFKKQEEIKEDKSNEETKEVDYDSLDTLGKLEYLSTKDKRINKIIDNYDKYPEILLEMLTRNSDMTSYMLDYPEKKGNVYKDNIGKVQKGKFPLLLQYDKNWGYGIYGDNVLAINGCGPTVLSMVVAGLTGKNDITPYTIAEYSSDHGYYQSEWGTSWSLMTEGIKNFGVVGANIELSKENVFSELEKGHPIVCSMRPGDFTTIGHFILLTGIKDGKITVNDPNSKERSNKLWDYETLEYQIKSLWSFTTL